MRICHPNLRHRYSLTGRFDRCLNVDFESDFLLMLLRASNTHQHRKLPRLCLFTHTTLEKIPRRRVRA